MARQVNRLTARAVQTLSEPGRHADGDGLYLVVDEGGAKRWVLLYRMGGKRREMGLGSAATVKLADARERARDAREKVARGVDPVEDRKGVRPVSSFKSLGDVAHAYIDAKADGWRGSKTRAGWERSFDQHARDIKDTPVDAVTTEDVLSVLRPIWTTKAESAGKLRDRLETVLDAAKAMGLRTGENPARWRGHLEHMLAERPKLTRGHMAAMPYKDVPAFMAKLAAREGMSARALEWTILTASRETMTLGATWDELETATLWAVPPERMKSGKEHRVPLPAAVKAVVPERQDEGPGALLFPGARGGQLSNMSMDMMLRRLSPGFTVHGFRSSFRDWAGDCTDHAREVVEAALAHAVGDAVERAYRRGDALEKRRKLMQDWADYCLSKR